MRNNQIDYVVAKLRDNPDTRHAAISIYDAKEYNKYAKDTPCTYAIQFTIINNKLGMPMSLARPGIVLINAATVPCVGLEGVGLEATKIPLTALLLDRRWVCNGQCKGPGFYGFIPACSSLEPTVLWRASPVPPEGCVGGDTVYQIQRSIIYSRPYSWRVDDGLPAIMLREQATEPDARWLRSSMLAPEILDWQIDCVAGCAQERQRASPLWGYKLRFLAQGRHLSQLVERTVALSVKVHE